MIAPRGTWRASLSERRRSEAESSDCCGTVLTESSERVGLMLTSSPRAARHRAAAQFPRQDHSSRRHRHEDWYARPDAAAADGAAGPARHRCNECVRGIARARHAQCDGCCLRYLSSRRLRHEEWYLRRACRRDRDDHGWQLGHLRNLLMHPARPLTPFRRPSHALSRTCRPLPFASRAPHALPSYLCT